VKAEMLDSAKSIPLVIRPVAGNLRLVAWAAENREYLEAQLHKHGAILFRDFAIDNTTEFEQFVSAISGSLMDYNDRATPRRPVHGKIYTSTEYPPTHRIFLHNENSFAHTFPRKIFFFCELAAREGGATPICDVRKVFQRLSPEIRDRFAEKNVLYVRNFGDGFGLPWQSIFNTEDKTTLEDNCRRAGIEIEWKDEHRLRTRQSRPAMARHPHTGEMVWFNHATVLHVSTLEPPLRDQLLKGFSEEDLPNNTYYGDGSRIEPPVLDALRDAYLQEKVTFDWRKGDVLMLDNVLVAHGREPFKGARKIVVGMAQPTSWAEIETRAPTDAVGEVTANSDEYETVPAHELSRRVDVARKSLPDAPPETPVEKILTEIWKNVLRLEQVALSDNFFDLGGQSLDAMMILARINDMLDVQLPIRAVADAPTVAELAKTILRDPDERARMEKRARLVLDLGGLSENEAAKMLGENSGRERDGR
ncbi:MAG: TauD/TfdA family dioxygenase, partial [Pyrinomonadaceae bacterium]